MRFPITPDYLEHVPEYIVRLYRDLDEYTLRDICRRLRGAGEITGSAVNQIRALRNRGLDLSYIDRRIKETLHLSEQEYGDIWSRAIARNQEYFDDVIQRADLVPSSFTLAAKEREFEAIRRQTLEEFRNISRSMGFAFRTGGGIQFLPIAKAYQKILDDAEMKLLSGVADYNTAIKEAVKQLTDSGLQYVDYASGWRNRVDVAARRAVMTGIAQIAAQYSQDTMALLGTDLVEVTAHSGARDRGSGYVNHKSWQGKVYSMSGKSKKYPGLHEVTGYGLGGGLAGWNCRHSFFAFVEGVSERAYTDKQLANIDPPPFDYQGRRYTAYEATQMQRKLETAMRQKKRELIGYEAAGLEEDHTAASIKLRRLQEEYAQFSKAAGLRQQPQRARVAGFGRGQAGRVAAAKVVDVEGGRLRALDRARQTRLLKDPSLALPNAEHAVLESDKFTKYLFNPDNLHGYAKGVAFTSRLGYDMDSWNGLMEEIRSRAALYPARCKGDSGHGMKYEQQMILYGKTGRPTNVIVGWIIENGHPRMTSAYIKEVKEHDD